MTAPRSAADGAAPVGATGMAPDLAALRDLGERALATLPEPFRLAAREVRLHVAEIADDATCRSLGIDDPYELTGLYDGVALTLRSIGDSGDMPATIWLYRRAILLEWIERGDVALEALVAHVVVHELAHHLGWSDEDIAEIDRWWE
ncbi:MAG: metallopeptidase family protein [Pseudomonadota bacterium]